MAKSDRWDLPACSIDDCGQPRRTLGYVYTTTTRNDTGETRWEAHRQHRSSARSTSVAVRCMRGDGALCIISGGSSTATLSHRSAPTELRLLCNRVRRDEGEKETPGALGRGFSIWPNGGTFKNLRGNPHRGGSLGLV